MSDDDTTQFAYFPDQKVKRLGETAIIPQPSQFDKEIEEVKSIVKSFRQENIKAQETVKRLFQKNKWKIDYRFFSEKGLWDFDAYKNGVAVEVLGKNVDELYKNCFKFLLAFKAGRIRTGVVIVPHRKLRTSHPDAISVDAILHRFSPVLQDYGLWIFRASYLTDLNT